MENPASCTGHARLLQPIMNQSSHRWSQNISQILGCNTAETLWTSSTFWIEVVEGVSFSIGGVHGLWKNKPFLLLTNRKEQRKDQNTLIDWHDIGFKEYIDNDYSVYEFLEERRLQIFIAFPLTRTKFLKVKRSKLKSSSRIPMNI